MTEQPSGEIDAAFEQALAETRAEYREALDRLADTEPSAEKGAACDSCSAPRNAHPTERCRRRVWMTLDVPAPQHYPGTATAADEERVFRDENRVRDREHLSDAAEEARRDDA